MAKVKEKHTKKISKKITAPGNALEHIKKKLNNDAPGHEPASPVCYAGREKFREGFEDLLPGSPDPEKE